MQGCEDRLHLITTVLDAAQAQELTPHLQQEQVLVKEVIQETIAQVEPLQGQEHPLHLEVFNVANTPHFANPGSAVSSAVFNPNGTVASLAVTR